MINKIIIGAANFGNFYGLKKKSLNPKKIIQIINYAKKIGIHHYDTAGDYNKSESFLGEAIELIYGKKIKKIKIDTKLKINNKNQKNIFIKFTQNSIKNLKIKRINTFYIHNASLITRQNAKEISNQLNILKKKKIIKKIGISVYSPAELLNIIKFFKIDVVQIPFNIIDRRFAKKKIIKILKRKKIKIIARSIFLKGLILKNVNIIPKKLLEFKPILKKLKNYARLNNISLMGLCLSYVLNQNFLDKIIIGISNLNQLNGIKIIVKKKYKFKNYPKIKLTNYKILDPRTW